MILIVFIAFLYGCATVISKMINYRAAQELGTWNGSLVNYVVASVLALVMLLVTTFKWIYALISKRLFTCMRVEHLA